MRMRTIPDGVGVASSHAKSKEPVEQRQNEFGGDQVQWRATGDPQPVAPSRSVRLWAHHIGARSLGGHSFNEGSFQIIMNAQAPIQP